MKKIVAFILVLTMLLTLLAGCLKNESPDDDGGKNNDVSSQDKPPSSDEGLENNGNNNEENDNAGDNGNNNEDDDKTFPPLGDLPDAQRERYNMALYLLAEGNLYGAYDVFLTISDFEDVPEYLSRFYFGYEKKEQIKLNGDDGWVTVVEYDDYGREIKSTLTAGDRVWNKSLYWYDEKGYLSGYSQETSWYEHYVYKYDDMGRPISQRGYRGLGDIDLEYDENGNITKVIYIGGGETYKTYDESGNLLQEIRNDKNGETYHKVTYEYNEYGDWTKKVTEGTLVKSQTTTRYLEYDENGNMIKSSSVENPEKKGEAYTTWEYDEFGNVIKQSIYYSKNNSFGEEFVIFHFKYDEHGNLIESSRENEKGFTHFDYYEYDKYGNLLISKTEDYTLVYSDYKLYYNPYVVFPEGNPTAFIPEDMWTSKG